MMFISSCYFIYNARRDTVAEREFDIVIQMTLERVPVERFKKKEMGQQRHVNVTKQVNSYGTDFISISDEIYFRK